MCVGVSVCKSVCVSVRVSYLARTQVEGPAYQLHSLALARFSASLPPPDISDSCFVTFLLLLLLYFVYFFGSCCCLLLSLFILLRSSLVTHRERNYCKATRD